MHFEKIETTGLPLGSSTNNSQNQNFKLQSNLINSNNNNFQNQINANLNQQYNEKIMKLSNEIIICLFKGVNFFAEKYLNKKTILANKTKINNDRNNNNEYNYKFIAGVEEEKYFVSKAELKIVYKILSILNKFNFLKAKPMIGVSSILSPRNTITETAPNLALAAISLPSTTNNNNNYNNQTTLASTNANVNVNVNASNNPSKPVDSVNQMANNQLTNVKANFILQKFLIKYTENKPQSQPQNSVNALVKVDYIDEILDNIESIVRSFQQIIFKDILEKIAAVKINNINRNKQDIQNNNNNNRSSDIDQNTLNSLADNSEFYLEILNFIKTLSSNSGYTLFLIKSGVYLFTLYFLNKYESKQLLKASSSLKATKKAKEFLNQTAQISYFILKNLITHTHLFLRSQALPRVNSTSNFTPQLSQQIQNPTAYFAEETNSGNLNNLNLKNQKSERLEIANSNFIPASAATNSNITNAAATATTTTINNINSVNSKNQEISIFNKLAKVYQMFDKVIKNFLQNFFYELILNPISSIANKEQGAIIKLETITPDSQSLAFLSSFKSSIENPDFIWNKNYRKELKQVLFKQLKKLNEAKFKINFYLVLNPLTTTINNNSNANNIANLNSVNVSGAENSAEPNSKINLQNVSTMTKLNSNSSIVNNFNYINYENKSEYEVVNIEHLENLQIFEYCSSKKELRIGKIFIRVYNKNNEFKLDNANQFLEALKQNLLDIEFENFNYKDFVENFKKDENKNINFEKENNQELKNLIENNEINENKNNFNNEIMLVKEKEREFASLDFINNEKTESEKNFIMSPARNAAAENENVYFYYDENSKLNFNVIDELLKAISNVISNSKADETILLNDSKFVEKFYKLLNENINLNKEVNEKLKLSVKDESEKNHFDSLHNNNTNNNNNLHNIASSTPKSPNIKASSRINIFVNFKNNLNKKIKNSKLEIDKENIFTLLNINNLNYDSTDAVEAEQAKMIDLIPSCLNLLYILSMINPESMKFVLNQNIIFIILKIINNFNTKSHIDPIIRILRLINKNPEFVDKLNISVFLFLLKKIVSFRDLNNYILEEEKLLTKAIDKLSKKVKNIKSENLRDKNFNHNQNNTDKKPTYTNENNNNSDELNPNPKVTEYTEKIENFENQRQILKEAYEKMQQLGIDIIKIIKKFISNERIGFAIKGIFEFYLPNKIIDSLFLSKETNESSIKCLGEELELPDLIWNIEAIQQSKRILDEDTIFILNDEVNLDNFPQNLISHKLLPQKCFFFEISDEYRLDNIYVRIFNKDPAYNLGKNLIIFLKHVFNDSLNNYKKLAFFEFFIKNTSKNFDKNIKITNKDDLEINSSINNSDSSNKENDLFISVKPSKLIIESLQRQILCGFTAILLIIEQINFNDFNDNLGISSIEEMKNLIKDENEKNLISLVQRSFEYQNLLSVNFVKKLINLILYAFDINENNFSNNINEKNKLNHKSLSEFLCFNGNLRLLFLQILYLLCVNKKAINIFYNMIDVNELLEKFYEKEEEVTDGILKFYLRNV